MIETPKIQKLRREHTEAFEARDWPRMSRINSQIIREWNRLRQAEDKKQKREVAR